MAQLVSEDDFRRHMIKLLEQHGYHVSHIESHLTSAGIPDLNAWKGRWPEGRDLWLELKIIKDNKVKMRPTQRAWHKKRAEAGGHSWVLVLDPKRQDVLWLSGDRAAALPAAAEAWRDASNTLPLASMFVLFNKLSYGD